MTSHNHGFKYWPFEVPENVAAICCRHVLEGRAILRVTHDEDDGGWQILCGDGNHVQEDARVFCLGCMVQRDETLTSLADLPLGWCAERETKELEWVRAINPGWVDEDEDLA